ncbi:hypothetical protein GCM10023212_16310 [Luteolibacter yonseiensis]
MGGGSLMIAVIFHGVLLVFGALWVFKIINPPDEKVDFMPRGGDAGSRAAEVQVQQKKRAQITPVNQVKRVFAQNAESSYSIPDPGDDFGPMSSLSSLSSGGGGGAGGLGGPGAGKGFGQGKGGAGGLGNGLHSNIKLFGMDLKVESIGLVLDVSGSMTPRLKRVVDEANRVAEGSPVILHVGCGLGAGKNQTGRIEPVRGPRDDFKRFWYFNQHRDRETRPKKQDDMDISGPPPVPEVYDVLVNRPQTYYHDHGRGAMTADALLCSELRKVEAVYWFADFQDEILPETAEEILKELKRKKQKLYIHAAVKGKYYEAARDMIAVPSGGGEVKPIGL